jgi:hypothetical protein
MEVANIDKITVCTVVKKFLEEVSVYFVVVYVGQSK